MKENLQSKQEKSSWALVQHQVLNHQLVQPLEQILIRNMVALEIKILLKWDIIMISNLDLMHAMIHIPRHRVPLLLQLKKKRKSKKRN